MATDPKLVAQMLDLSRNVEKLTGELRKNTSVTGDLVKAQETAEETKITEKPKILDDKKILDSLKGIDFNVLKDTLGNLNDSIKKIDNIDFKNLGDTIKTLDPKKFQESFKQLGNLKDIGKNIISGGDIGKMSLGPIKEIIGGSIPKIGGDLFGKKGLGGILGGLKDGGDVNFSGKYIVGEAGPEILELDKGDRVIPNKDIKSFIDGRIPDLQKKKTPTREEIEEKKNELIKENPGFYKDPAELAEEIAYFIENYEKNKEEEKNTFTREDIKKLSEPVKKNELNASKTLEKSQESGIIEKINPKGPLNVVNPDKLNETDKSKKRSFSDILNSDSVSKGSEILGGFMLDKKPSLSEVSNIFKKPSDLLRKIDSGKIQDSIKSLGGVGTPGFMENKSNILKSPLGEFKKNVPLLKEQTVQKNKVETPSSVTQNLLNASADNKSSNPETSSSIQAPSQNPVQTTQSSQNASSTKSENTQESINAKDIQEIKSLLARIAAALSGTLMVSPMEAPYRPDSRRV